jgi:DNA-binding Lrp family transcriptional regulator
MIAQERYQAICGLLARNRKATIEELQRELNVSPATLRRDLAELEAQSQLIRVRGAVVHPAYFRGEPTLAQKSRTAGEAKRRIARVAAELVPPGSTVLLDAWFDVSGAGSFASDTARCDAHHSFAAARGAGVRRRREGARCVSGRRSALD